MCLSNNEWINIMWYIHTMEHYLAIKRTELLMQATTWVNLENTVLSEKKPVTDHILYDYIYVKFPKQGNV